MLFILYRSKFPPAIKSKIPLLMLELLQLTSPTPPSSVFASHLEQKPIEGCWEDLYTHSGGANRKFKPHKPQPECMNPFLGPTLSHSTSQSQTPLCSCHLDWLVPALLSSGNSKNNTSFHIFLVRMAFIISFNISTIPSQWWGRVHPDLVGVTIKHSFCLETFF